MPRNPMTAQRPSAPSSEHASASHRDFLCDWRSSPVLRWAGALGLFAITVGWFQVLRYQSLMGDDLTLNAFLSSRASFIEKVFLSAPGEKYRPVYHGAQYVLYKLFGDHYPLYLWFNICFHGGLAVLLYGVLARITRSNWLLAFGGGLLFVTARFAYYNIAQLLGFMEALALLELLAIVWCAVRYRETRSRRWLAWALIGLTLLLFTHERYLVVVPFLWLLVIAEPSLRWRHRIMWCIAFFAPVALNVLLKVLVFKGRFLLGTGGMSIKPDAASILRFWLAGMLNVFGINRGWDSLSIHDFPTLPPLHRGAGIVFAIAAFLAIAAYLWTDRREAVRIGVGWVTLVGALVLGASVTVRQEFRWLFAPFLVSLVFWAWALERLRPRTLAYGLSFVLVGTGVFNDWLMRKDHGNLFFTSAEVLADSFYSVSLKRYGSVGHDFYIEPFDYCDWVLPETTFFRQFAGPGAPHVRRVTPQTAAKWRPSDFPRTRVFAADTMGGMKEVTAHYAMLAALRDRTPLVGLVDEMAKAQVSGRRAGEEYPGGTSVSAISIDGRKAIFAHANSSIAITETLPSDGAVLVFGVGFHPIARDWGVSDGARAAVSVTGANGTSREVWTAYIAPADEEEVVEVPLSACAVDEPCTVTLSCSNDPGANASADWLVWVEPRVLVPSGAPLSTSMRTTAQE